MPGIWKLLLGSAVALVLLYGLFLVAFSELSLFFVPLVDRVSGE